MAGVPLSLILSLWGGKSGGPGCESPNDDSSSRLGLEIIGRRFPAMVGVSFLGGLQEGLIHAHRCWRSETWQRVKGAAGTMESPKSLILGLQCKDHRWEVL